MALNPYELSYNDAMRVLAIANKTITIAQELASLPGSAVLGILQATDTVFSVQQYNYIAGDFRDLNISRVYTNNTAGTTPVSIAAVGYQAC